MYGKALGSMRVHGLLDRGCSAGLEGCSAGLEGCSAGMKGLKRWVEWECSTRYKPGARLGPPAVSDNQVDL